MPVFLLTLLSRYWKPLGVTVVLIMALVSVRYCARKSVLLEYQNKSHEEVINRYESAQETSDKVKRKYEDLGNRLSSPTDELLSCILSNDPVIESCK